jgi:hypothetical protein
MSPEFEMESWYLADAVAYICWSTMDTGLQIKHSDLSLFIQKWIENPSRSIPTKEPAIKSRAERFLAATNAEFASQATSLRMNPVLWAWFAMSRAPEQIAPAFRYAFDAWNVHAVKCSVPQAIE